MLETLQTDPLRALEGALRLSDEDFAREVQARAPQISAYMGGFLHSHPRPWNGARVDDELDAAVSAGWRVAADPTATNGRETHIDGKLHKSCRVRQRAS